MLNSKRLSTIIGLVAVTVVFIASPTSIMGDNEDSPRHSHTNSVTKIGFCGGPSLLMWSENGCSYTEACYVVYEKTVEECSHGISCAAGCHYEVSDEHEHLRWCDVCEENYYYCQERHETSS